jgi:adenosylcobinamide kinase / adenosylcobinamide-phosphate guanylyltransferase
MDIRLLGTAGADGWPATGCGCASCARLRAAGIAYEPTRVLVDGVPLEECSRWKVPGGYDVRAPGGERLLVAEGPGACPEPLTEVVYDAVLLDLVGRPDHLGLLRRGGAVTGVTKIFPVYCDHRVPTVAELERRLEWLLRPRTGTYRTLVLGGSRSGKSAEAELRLLGNPFVTYVATGEAVCEDDPEWAARVQAHRARRPAWWRTEETTDLAHVLTSAAGAVLVDGIGGWLVAAMDQTGAWDEPAALEPAVAELVEAWRTTRAQVVAVSDEVGLSLVPTTRVGRAYRDALGRLNQRLAAESEETVLVVAGKVVELP